jgi:glucokinase
MIVLAGDIGGTKTNLGLFIKGKQRPVAQVSKRYSNRDAKNLAEILERFIHRYPAQIDGACFGIAGPVIQGRSKTTNLPWTVSEEQLRKCFNWSNVRVINDLEATAHAVPILQSRDLYVLNDIRIRKGQTLGLVAPGTGLGKALLVFHQGRYLPIPSEGGHVDFAPNSTQQLKLWAYLNQKYGHVSAERVASGHGLVNIYNWLKSSAKYSEPAWLADKMKSMDPARAISETALDKKNRLCMKSLELFVSMLGAIAGNLALTGMTTGGMYLGGGIPPKILPRVDPKGFMQSFVQKGRFKHVLEKIPVRVILNDKAALLGAANFAIEMRGDVNG